MDMTVPNVFQSMYWYYMVAVNCSTCNYISKYSFLHSVHEKKALEAKIL